jgi:hypothetical protein
MLKSAFITLLLIVASPCFSGQVSEFDHEIKSQSKSLALSYINRGNENLLSGKYFSAVNDFQNASSLISKLEDCKFDLDFLSHFGKVIAYDNLGLHEHCQSAMISLLLTVENRSESCAFESNETDTYRALATLAPSLSIQTILFYLCDTIQSSLEN